MNDFDSDEEYKPDSYLDWCIDNSFEIDEESKFTKKYFAKYLASAYHKENKWNKEIQIKAFKNYVEFNFVMKLLKWGLIVWVVLKMKNYFFNTTL